MHGGIGDAFISIFRLHIQENEKVNSMQFTKHAKQLLRNAEFKGRESFVKFICIGNQLGVD